MDQGDERERTADEVSKIVGQHQNRGLAELRDKSRGGPVYCLGGARHKGGVTLIQALVWNVGTCRADVKGETQVEAP